MKRLYIEVPYAEKDLAKSKGALWDEKVKKWYFLPVDDAMKFSRWFTSAKTVPSKQEMITLADFLKTNYKKTISLTYRSAKAFGIPYPLETGWVKKYANNTAKLSSLTVGKKIKKTASKTPVFKAEPKIVCNCNVPPWEDCEHTDALAMKAMKEMLTT